MRKESRTFVDEDGIRELHWKRVKWMHWQGFRWTRLNRKVYKLVEPKKELTVLVGVGPPGEAETAPGEAKKTTTGVRAA